MSFLDKKLESVQQMQASIRAAQILAEQTPSASHSTSSFLQKLPMNAYEQEIFNTLFQLPSLLTVEYHGSLKEIEVEVRFSPLLSVELCLIK